MSTSLSNLVDNLSEKIHSDNSTDCKSCLDYISVKDNQLIFKCSKFNENHNKDFNKDSINRFAITYEFCDRDINKFNFLLRKGVYPYECMDSWERFDETLLANKEDFYSSLNMEDITDVDYRHAKKAFKGFKMNNLGDYHDVYIQSGTLLLADVFEDFRNKYIEIYELDPAHFSSAPGLAWQACLKMTRVVLELLTGINILLMIEKRIRGGLCHIIDRYAEANNKYMKNYDETKNDHIL